MNECSLTIAKFNVRATGVKDRVERAAIALFAERGVDGVSIADIAARAGVAQGALYRHYRSKEALATQLFATAYFRAGAELAVICARESQFAARIAAMVAHFCALYDHDAPLFRFMLIAQHEVLPRVAQPGPTPVDAIETAVADAVAAGDIAAIAPAEGAAVIMGIVLQTALFHIYGRLTGPLLPRAPALAHAALAAIAALRG
jgi:AcrR family transcriptional regulator